MIKVPKNCGINEKKMAEILYTIKSDGSQKSIKTSNSNENVTDVSEIERIKQREIDNLAVERNTRKIKLTSAQRKNITQDTDEANSLESGGKKVTIKDFNMVKLVGKGSFGKVILILI